MSVANSICSNKNLENLPLSTVKLNSEIVHETCAIVSINRMERVKYKFQ